MYLCVKLCAPRFVTLRIGHMAGSLSLRLGRETVFCENFGFSSSLQSKLPYVPILRALNLLGLFLGDQIDEDQ